MFTFRDRLSLRSRRLEGLPRTSSCSWGSIFRCLKICDSAETAESRLPLPGFAETGRDVDRAAGRDPGRGDLRRVRQGAGLRPLVLLHPDLVRGLAGDAGREHPLGHAHSLSLETAAIRLRGDPRRAAGPAGRIDRDVQLRGRRHDLPGGGRDGRPRHGPRLEPLFCPVAAHWPASRTGPCRNSIFTPGPVDWPRRRESAPGRNQLR